MALNNYIQGHPRLSPLTWEEKQEGPSHAPEWTATVLIKGVEYSGTAPTKGAAKEIAAEKALAALISGA